MFFGNIRIPEILLVVFPLMWDANAQQATLPHPSDDYVIRTWTSDDGLPENSPTAFAQTSDGYLWIGTWNGLGRFDGVRFTTYHSGNSDAFLVSRISVLYVDRSDILWVGTGGGGLVRLNGSAFEHFGPDQGLLNQYVNGVAEDTNGRFWVATDGGLYLREGERFAPAGWNDPRLAGTITRIFADSAGTLWVTLLGRVLEVRVEGVKPRVIRDREGAAAVVGDEGSVWYWDGSWNLHRSKGRDATKYSQFSRLSYNSMFPLRDGGLGICALDRIIIVRGDTVWNLPKVQEKPIVTPEVMFEDREGNIWIGRASSGLSRVRRRTLKVIGRESGMRREVTTSVTGDGRGRMWIGMYRDAISIGDGHTFRPLTHPAVKSFETITLLWEDTDGSMWIGGTARGLTKIQPGRFSTYLRGLVGRSTTMTGVGRDPLGRFWAATAWDGVQRDDGVRVMILNAESGLSSNETTALLCASNGDVWIGTRAHGVNRVVDTTITHIGRGEGLTSNEIQVFFEGENGEIWIGTRRGLNRWTDGTIARFTEAEGLADEAVSSIVDDGRGNLWFGGIRGIFAVKKTDFDVVARGERSSLVSRKFGTEDGLIVPEVGGAGNPRAWKDDSGILWFVSERGLIRVDPALVGINTVPPSVIIEEVFVDHVPVSEGTEIVLGPEHSRLEFQFTGISFTSPSRVQFRYRLEGLDDVWEDGGTRRYAQYTHIPPGEYTFRVTAANSDGLWNETGATATFVVVPPFYETWWFISLLVLLFVTTGPTAYVVRVRALKREQARQHEFGRKLIERQEEERRRIARDMHDSLGQELLVLKHRIQSRLRKKKIAKETSTLLNDLSGTVSGTITLVRHISHNLRPPELDRLGLSETIRGLLERIRTTGVFDLRGEVDDVDGCFDKEDEINVVRIVQEALNNIIKHAHASNVIVSLTKKDTFVELEVEDNGVGIRDEGTSGPGIGLEDMRERSRLMGGTCEHTSGGRGGTLVRVILPRKK